MCGIFGIVSTDIHSIEHKKCPKILNALFKLSESRGKEASGLAFMFQDSIKILKSPETASILVKKNNYKKLINDWTINKGDFICIGHSRMVTHGSEFNNANNQPVNNPEMTLVHNGIIVNDNELWEKYVPDDKRKELDSELIPVILKDTNYKKNLLNSLNIFFSEIKGMTSFAALISDRNEMILATNNGSLYMLFKKKGHLLIFASESLILKKLTTQMKWDISEYTIIRLEGGMVSTISLVDAAVSLYDYKNITSDIELNAKESLSIFDISDTNNNVVIKNNASGEDIVKRNGFDSFFNDRLAEINNLKRCNKCLLPESFPFIEFDNNGTCNFCNHHKPIKILSKDLLLSKVDSFRRNDAKPDSIITFSGGRDSCYCLHLVKKELKMNPIAYTYDWGMVTDIARRNQSRMCGILGVEHILVSADIRKKRDNIRKNVLAWLKSPSLGTIPLFMAGDKQYFYFANQLMKEYQLKLVFFGENKYENTNFKSGFTGINPNFSKKKIHTLSLTEQMKMGFFYMKEFLKNPAYINSTLFDTIWAFFSYYQIPHDYLDIFSFYMWDEKLVNDVLINEYNWETEAGYNSTWRIGDGTAAFYNYIYYIIAGFSENDTFRSNQIRQGAITREEGMSLIAQENQPRWEAIKWYCDTIGVDFERTIKQINQIKKFY